MFKRFVVAAVVTFIYAKAAFAGTTPYEPGKVSVWIPEGWHSEAKADAGGARLLAVDPAGNAMALYAVIDAKDLGKAKGKIDQFLGAFVTDLKPDGKPEALTINGMQGLSFDFTGKAQGNPVAASVLLLETPAKKVLIVVGILNAAKAAEYADTVVKMVQGIQPMK